MARKSPYRTEKQIDVEIQAALSIGQLENLQKSVKLKIATNCWDRFKL